MGQMKHAWQEAHDRGWKSIGKFVCAKCIDETFLKELIKDNVQSRACSYCGDRARSKIAAPVDVILESIFEAMHIYFGEPSTSGVPYEWREGGYLVDPMSTEDALMELELDVEAALFKDIANSFYNEEWVPASGGSWVGSSYGDHLKAGWDSFAYNVKHTSRYFFSASNHDETRDIYSSSIVDILSELGLIAQERLCNDIAEDTPLYRVREWPDPVEHFRWTPTWDQMGAPADIDSSAGRMNPAGISYLYLAFEQDTAIAEIVKETPKVIGLATFKTARNLTILNLCELPPIPSVFDCSHEREREVAIFLMHSVQDMRKPVDKDGREHIDYVPSQIVCEYFRQVFNLGSKEEPKRLDSIVYPSKMEQDGVRSFIITSNML